MVKTIPQSEINPIFLLPIDERVKAVNEMLTKLHEIMPDIKYFEDWEETK
ncbi:MAG: hypothetical protein LLG05_18695 [Porphyromonadaceae bacterium]|nr:hypothetical protein [Porphyromonadaceae bacterium]